MRKPTIKREKSTKVEFVGRLCRYSWGTGQKYQYENGLAIQELRDRHAKVVYITPTEGGPVNWVDALIEEWKIFRAALVEEQNTRE